jgi:hypothetical protein
VASIDLGHGCDVSCPRIVDLERVARGRVEIHRGQSTSNPIRQDREYLGISGEHAFHRATGLPLDMTIRRAGDGGHDFLVHGIAIDVKCVSDLGRMLVGTNERRCDLRVLAHYRSLGRSRLIGWEFDDVIHLAPTRPGRNNYTNHVILAQNLRPMSELWEYFGVQNSLEEQWAYADS